MPKISDFPDAGPLDGTELIPMLQAGVEVTGTVEDLVELAEYSSRHFSKTVAVRETNSTTTPDTIDAFTQVLEPGTYRLDGLVVYQAATTGTGLQMYVNCVGGTLGRVYMMWYQVTTGTTDATGVGDGATTANNQILEGKTQRDNNLPSGATAGVDTANADVMAILEGVVVVTAETELRIMFNSSNTNQVAIEVGSNLLITRDV